jgi:guanylate kinase
VSVWLGRRDPLLVVVGPSGSGKSTVVAALVDAGVLEMTPSWTTRPPRAEERQRCVEHRFVSEADFDRLEAEAYFLDTVQMFGLPYRYGIPPVRRPDGRATAVVMLRAGLLGMLGRHYDRPLIYQIEDNRERVAARLRQRHPDAAELGSRLEDYDREVLLGRTQAHRTFLNAADIPTLAEQVKGALAMDLSRAPGAPVL